MFISNQPKENQQYYERLLKAVGSLSNLFSESSKPYIAPRAAENIFCKAFGAENLSRSDASADASKNGIGVGIKTFLEQNGKSLQKVAEFNGEYDLFSSLQPEEKILKISELRNERILTTKRIFGLDDLIYHCVVRDSGKVSVFETPMDLVDVASIGNIEASNRTIRFSDKNNEYSFNISKSTLYKRFVTHNTSLEIPVRILEDPFGQLDKLIAEAGIIFSPIKVTPHIFLPLYSTKKGVKYVPEKSGLNQWNASGRLRDQNEIYIPIPAWIHRKFPRFFPDRDHPFELVLPDRKILSAKVCQDGSKALMTNPNSSLGEWLLRNVLNLKEGELLTYEKLQKIGLDSVVIYKIDSNTYDIDFTRIGTFENFEWENGLPASQSESPEEGFDE